MLKINKTILYLQFYFYKYIKQIQVLFILLDFSVTKRTAHVAKYAHIEQ